MRGPIATAIGAAILTAACGADPGPSAQLIEPEPPPAKPAPTVTPPATPDIIRITAPEGVDRWEPSGAVAHGDRLWVVNDRDGWLVAYDLPLKPGRNAPTVAHQVIVQPGKIKFEGLAPVGDRGLLLLETMKRSVWRCDDPEEGCTTVRRLELDPALDALEASVPKPVNYITYEAVASRGDALWVGSRGYETKDGTFHPWAIVAEPDGRTTYAGYPWSLGGRDYGLSDLSRDGDTLWMTWSHEAPGSRRSDVAGLVAQAPIEADGRPGTPVLCRQVPGKPEGITRHGDAVLVIFDQDADRKDPTDKSKFPYARDEDVVMVLPADCPDGREKPMPPTGG